MGLMLHPRRALISIGLFACLTAGGIVGLAAATDETSPEPVFVFAEPREGDMGRYRVTSDVDAWSFGRMERADGTLSFEHRGRYATLDGRGIPHVVDEVAFHDDRHDPMDFWGADGRRATILHAVTGQSIADVDEWNHEDEEDATDEGLARVVRHHDPAWSYDDNLPCGLRLQLQGRTAQVGDRAPAFGCNGHILRPGDQAWFQVDVVGADGNASQVSLWHDGQGQPIATLLYSADIPYPVRIDVQERGDWIGTFQLEAFERGRTPLPAPSSLQLPLPRALDLAPRTPWMFDETGIDHGFPLSEAVTHARSDDTQEFGAWMAAHPDAYIVDLSYWDYAGSTPRIEWRATFREAQDLYHLHIGKRLAVDQATPGAVDDALDDLLGNQADEPIYYFQASTRNVEEFGSWHPAPAELPTVASMWSFYDAWASPALREAGPNMYEIWIVGDDEGNRIQISAGRFQDFPEGRGSDPSIAYSRDWAFLAIELGDEPRIDRFSDRGYDKPATPAEPSSPPAPLALQPVASAPLLGLTGQEAAGIGVGAGLLSFLYYAWPHVKAGAVGLFSRVRKDEVLHHPVRQQVMELIAASPGIHFQQLVRATGKGKGTVDHHLRMLQDKELVRVRRGAGFRCYFLPGQVDHRLMDSAAVLKAPAARSILVRLGRPQRITDLASALGITKSAVSRHVQRLQGAGLLERRVDGRDQWLERTELGRMAAR